MKRMIASCVLLISLTACADEVDVAGIEAEVAAGIEEQANITGVTVDCPSSVEWKTGEEFHCFADDGTDSVRVTVSMENDAGEWSWVVD